MRLATTERRDAERHQHLLQRAQVVSAKGEIMGKVQSALLERGIRNQWMPFVGQHFSDFRDIGAQRENPFYYLTAASADGIHQESVTDR